MRSCKDRGYKEMCKLVSILGLSAILAIIVSMIYCYDLAGKAVVEQNEFQIIVFIDQAEYIAEPSESVQHATGRFVFQHFWNKTFPIIRAIMIICVICIALVYPLWFLGCFIIAFFSDISVWLSNVFDRNQHKC